uniref:Uncharacterized protein n=1 Tax=Avena sativa TaxID=4498 RepID=A0ACD5Y2D8_AVESA
MSRRFLNMVVHEYGTRLYTLCRIDLKKHLFCESTEAAASAQHLAKAKKMRDGWPSTVSNCKRPPTSEISFSAPPSIASNSKFHFFSLLPGQGEGCVMATDPHGNAAIYDAGMESVLLLPPANFPKPADSISLPLTLPRRPSTPTSHEDEHALLVMSKWDGTFEFFNYCKTGVYDYPTVDNKWYWCTLPRLPPWLGDSGANVDNDNRPFAAAVVDNTTIYVSSKVGTYAYDLRKGVWRHAGNWVLPFQGSAEYVPELGIWFGVKGPDSPHHRLCAFDLNSSDSGPSSLYDWDYLDFLLPDEWLPSEERQLVNLGSGKFVIVTYCRHISSTSSDKEEDCTKVNKFSNKELTLLTGVEVVDRGGGGGIEMIKHKSQRYNIDNTKIHSVL